MTYAVNLTCPHISRTFPIFTHITHSSGLISAPNLV